MKPEKSYLRAVLAVLGGSLTIGAYPLIVYAESGVALGVVIGAVLATVNILVGLAAIEYSIGQSMTTFLKVVIGGMGLRLGVILATIGICIKILGIHVAALTLSLFYFYAVYLIIEIVYIQKKVRQRTSHVPRTSN